jgi:hypothetical protein
MALSSTAVAWNIPGHMLSATIAYQILLQENPQTIDKVKAVLEKHPWYANQWRQARLQHIPAADHGLVASASVCARLETKSSSIVTVFYIVLSLCFLT